MASSTPTWVFGSNFQVELKNGKATRLQSLESPYCLIGPSGKPLLDSREIEGSILITWHYQGDKPEGTVSAEGAIFAGRDEGTLPFYSYGL